MIIDKSQRYSATLGMNSRVIFDNHFDLKVGHMTNKYTINMNTILRLVPLRQYSSLKFPSFYPSPQENLSISTSHDINPLIRDQYNPCSNRGALYVCYVYVIIYLCTLGNTISHDTYANMTTHEQYYNISQYDHPVVLRGVPATVIHTTPPPPPTMAERTSTLWTMLLEKAEELEACSWLYKH